MSFGEPGGEGFMVASSSDAHWLLPFVMLQHVMAQLVQKNVLEYESPQRAARPVHERCADLGQQSQDRACALKPAGNLAFQQSGQSPGRHRLLEEDDSARHAVSRKDRHKRRTVRGRPIQFDGAQTVESDWSNGLERSQHILLVGGMVKPMARRPYDDSQPRRPTPRFSRDRATLRQREPQLAPSTQIVRTASFAWGAEAANGANCLWVGVFAAGHTSMVLRFHSLPMASSEARKFMRYRLSSATDWPWELLGGFASPLKVFHQKH